MSDPEAPPPGRDHLTDLAVAAIICVIGLVVVIFWLPA